MKIMLFRWIVKHSHFLKKNGQVVWEDYKYHLHLQP